MYAKVKAFLGPMLIGVLLTLLGLFAYDYLGVRQAALKGEAAFNYIQQVVSAQQKSAGAPQSQVPPAVK